jgi:hypothetical protein
VCAEEELFFFLGSGEREREGEQVLLTWALGASANIFFSVSSLFIIITIQDIQPIE